MPIYENKTGLNFSSVSEDNMNKLIIKNDALGIYCVGNGFGRIEGFEKYYQQGITYKMFVNRMVKAGLLIQKR